MDGQGLKEASSGGVGTSVTYVSFIPFDGVSSGMECSARAEVARSQLNTDLWCTLIQWAKVLLVCPM